MSTSLTIDLDEICSLMVDPIIREFLHHALAQADSAHSIEHAIRVFENALNIMSIEDISLTLIEVAEIKLATLCHDVLDHKLVATGRAVPTDKVEEFYRKYFTLISRQDVDTHVRKICHIHNNCSWSKRHNSVPLEDGDWMRQLVQDADWLDAIGTIGLERCIEFTKSMNPAADDKEIARAVCKHIKEKLLLIPNELHFQASRSLAAGALVPLREFLAKHDEQ